MEKVKSWPVFLLHWGSFLCLLAVAPLLSLVIGAQLKEPYGITAAALCLVVCGWAVIRYRAHARIICLYVLVMLAFAFIWFVFGWLVALCTALWVACLVGSCFAKDGEKFSTFSGFFIFGASGFIWAAFGWGWGVAAFLAFGCLFVLFEQKPQNPLTVLGSAAMNVFEGWPQEAAFSGFDLFFGRNTQKPKNWNGGNASKHLLTIAPTRSGKGACLIIPNLLFWGGSAVVIDPKGENAYATAPRRRAMGQKTIILDPWDEVNRRYGQQSGEFEEVARFNPLSILDLSSPNYEDDVAYIADALIINQGKDPHWDDSARELVAGLIDFTIREQGENASLPAVRLLITKDAKEIAGIAEKAKAFGPFSLAAKKLSRFKIEGKENASIISTAATQTAFLDNRALTENLAESSFSFSDLVEGKATLYLVLPVDKLYTYGRWLRLMVSIGIRTVARTTKSLPQPVLFFLDEFGTIGRLAAVSQAVGLMAGLQMCIWIFVQDLLQLKRDYPTEWETFVANSGNIIFFNVMDQFSGDYLSKMTGQATVVYESAKTRDYRERYEKGTLQQGEVPPHDPVYGRQLMFPDEIRRLDQNHGISIDQFGPRLFSKAYYFKEAAFASLVRKNPYYIG